MSSQNKASEDRVNADPELDLRAIARALWINRFLISTASASALFASFVIAFLVISPTYTSTAYLISTTPPPDEKLGAAAALLGKNIAGSADAMLYQSILTSRIVLEQVLASSFRVSNDPEEKPTALAAILDIDTSDKVLVEATIRSLQKKIRIDDKFSNSGGVLEISFNAPSAALSRDFGIKAMELADLELEKIRSGRTKVVAHRLQLAVNAAKHAFDSAAFRLANFQDRNRTSSLPSQALEMSQLEMEKSAKEQTYLLARREYEQVLLDAEKASAPLYVISSPNLPAKKSAPKRGLIMLLGLIVGFTFSSAYVLGFKRAPVIQA